MRRSVLIAFVLAAACGGTDPKQAGEECVASSECATGLVCDFGQNPAVCAGMGTPMPDANPDAPVPDADLTMPDAPAPPIDAPPIDAPPIDAPPPDAETPDAMAPDAGAMPDA
jgi:hypothetical protein